MKYIVEHNNYWNYRLNLRFFDMLFNHEKEDILLTWNSE